MSVMTTEQRTATRGSGSSSLYDVLELVLDKGLVIDAYVRVSLVGIELVTIDVRIVVASVDTYLRFAEATNRLDLSRSKDSTTLPELVDKMQEGGAESKASGALRGAAGAVSSAVRGRGEDKEKREPQKTRRSRESNEGGE